jgi:hypothetical protein
MINSLYDNFIELRTALSPSPHKSFIKNFVIKHLNVPLIRSPIARRKFSISTSVFFTSAEYTSDPTIGQNGTFDPSSWAMANAMAVFPVPGGPNKRIKFDKLIRQVPVEQSRLCILVFSTYLPTAQLALPFSST